MFISVFDIFKIGIGPSSSHTMGPMVAAARFLESLRTRKLSPARLKATLYGSLAFTGVGHGTDRATILGLAGFAPDTFDPEAAQFALDKVTATKTLAPPGFETLQFNPKTDLTFDFDAPFENHANRMTLTALAADHSLLLEETYLSVGGGFVQTPSEYLDETVTQTSDVPFPFTTAEGLLEMCRTSEHSIAELKRANELACCAPSDLNEGLLRIWTTMKTCMNRGLSARGILPGGLNVRRRASDIYASLSAERRANQTAGHVVNEWISVYAMAVNEENAAGGQVVTAPTNGAAGVVPASLRYWLDHVPEATQADIETFLLTAAAVGGIIKFNASISGAECGCQAEVGSASAMAAAGLAAVMGGTPAQVETAAEIALEHHLGMTCDPIKGLVQVPCIERNGLGAVKAVTAASLALRGDGTHIVSLDSAIATMRETGADMSEKYKETSLGGLAVNVPNC
ncbi:L-serine ammonia-lyase [Pseudophaeobacter sp.]|uniref:L-serine ammonia-lyase n=1 Tax=Pseudophaeobacter sp. TaxID=1971739 RepID=UPI003A9769F3